MPKSSKRRTLSAQFKFKVAVEALKGIRGINEIAAENEVHPAQVAAWKKELMEGGSVLFERKNARNREAGDEEARTAALEQALGRVVVEKEFLLKKCKQLGIEP
jgi:transposase